ncbi:MAG TPA: alpha/beta hydrolase [Steroidobacteraceae bacterium]|nr:alpha/beta hydrolase [Steroidobacteraceae bacterium]
MTEGTPPRPLALRADDGRELAALLLEAGAARGALAVNGATGFRREFYLKFAGYCAQRGYHALVYDYRGIGASACAPLGKERARMSEWGRLDMPAALESLAQRYPYLPLFTLGHSVGGQLIGCMPNQSRARAHVMIAASTGYWRRQRLPFRYQALIFWKIYGPLMLRRRGYVPRGVVWTGESLPAGVFLQWRDWCLSAAPFGATLDADLHDDGFAAVRAPLLAWGFSDDPIATPAAVEALLGSYRNARIERRWTSPAEAGARSIGHHGFFAERHRDSLWRGALDWIDARCA